MSRSDTAATPWSAKRRAGGVKNCSPDLIASHRRSRRPPRPSRPRVRTFGANHHDFARASVRSRRPNVSWQRSGLRNSDDAGTRHIRISGIWICPNCFDGQQNPYMTCNVGVPPMCLSAATIASTGEGRPPDLPEVRGAKYLPHVIKLPSSTRRATLSFRRLLGRQHPASELMMSYCSPRNVISSSGNQSHSLGIAEPADRTWVRSVAILRLCPGVTLRDLIVREGEGS